MQKVPFRSAKGHLLYFHQPRPLFICCRNWHAGPSFRPSVQSLWPLSQRLFHVFKVDKLTSHFALGYHLYQFLMAFRCNPFACKYVRNGHADGYAENNQ